MALDANEDRVKFIAELDHKDQFPAYKAYDNFDITKAALSDHDLMGGSILRPLNSSTWKNIPSPFVEIIQGYGDGEYVNYYNFVLWGDEKFFKQDKKYEIYFLSGPDTTKDEHDYLDSLNTKWSVENPGCCMNENLAEIIERGASKIIITDYETAHQKILGVIEQARIVGSNRMFGRILDSYHQYLAVGYWKPTKKILEKGEILTIVFDGKAYFIEYGTISNTEYEGIYESLTWEKSVALPPQNIVIKTFYL